MEIRSKESYNMLLNEREVSLKSYSAEQNERIKQITQELRNKEIHIGQLQQSGQSLQNELNRINNSRSWRLLRIIWRVRDILAPHGSIRALMLRISWMFLRHPVKFLHKCTPKRIGNFFRLLRKEGAGQTSGHLKNTVLDIVAPTVELPPTTANERVDMQESHLEEENSNMSVCEQHPEEEDISFSSYEPLVAPACFEPKVSIIIPVYNQFDYTYQCIKSIIEHSDDIPYEIIIADDCSTDVTKQIGKIISCVSVVRNDVNLRFLYNCNKAAKKAKGQYILFLNNDTQVLEHWLTALVELIERAADIGMVGSKLVYPDGRLQEAGGILWKDGSAWNYGNGADPSLPEYNYVKEVDYISGAAIMIRRSLWEEIGGFDERFAPAYCEDSDLAFEVRRRGYRVMFQPASVVVHFEGVSNGTDLSSGQKAYQVENQKKFYEKWKDVLSAEYNTNGDNPFLARERGIGARVLLMVDHYVPQFDKDAGSRTVYQYLQLFVNTGFHVKFIGDNFYQHQPYTKMLQQMGVEVLYGPYYAEHWQEWLQENGQSIRYAFLNRPHISVKYIDEVRKYTPARIVYYGHDLHFMRERREYEITKDKAKLQASEALKEQELALIRKADMAYYPSSVEVDEIHRIDPMLHVKAIPAYLFSDIIKPEYHAGQRKDMLFIGGFSHGPNVDAVKWLAAEIMPELVKNIPDVKVNILGSNPPEEIKALGTEQFRIVGFVTDEELEWYYKNCRLAIVPLRYGAGIKGKVVEAMRYGLPIVTTSIGAEGIIGAEDFLTIADESKTFAEKTASLYRDNKDLETKSNDSFRYLLEHFSPDNAREVICAEFDME